MNIFGETNEDDMNRTSQFGLAVAVVAGVVWAAFEIAFWLMPLSQ